MTKRGFCQGARIGSFKRFNPKLIFSTICLALIAIKIININTGHFYFYFLASL